MVTRAKSAILGDYPNAIINSSPTPVKTGNFEVTIRFEDGEESLIYSKKNGEGAFTDDKKAGLLAKLNEVVANRKSK